MNLNVFFTMYSVSFVSIVTSPNSRVNVAIKTHKSILKQVESKKISSELVENENKKISSSLLEDEQLKNPRSRGRKRTLSETTTTKSPLKILEEVEEKELIRNPKRVESPIQKKIKKFKNDLKILQGECKKNSDCRKNECCMIGAGAAHCTKFPKHYQRCSPQCPCSRNMECKVNVETNDKGDQTYSKQCLKITEPESPDIKKIEEAGRAKKRGTAKWNVDGSSKSNPPPGGRRQ